MYHRIIIPIDKAGGSDRETKTSTRGDIGGGGKGGAEARDYRLRYIESRIVTDKARISAQSEGGVMALDGIVCWRSMG